MKRVIVTAIVLVNMVAAQTARADFNPMDGTHVLAKQRFSDLHGADVSAPSSSFLTAADQLMIRRVRELSLEAARRVSASLYTYLARKGNGIGDDVLMIDVVTSSARVQASLLNVAVSAAGVTKGYSDAEEMRQGLKNISEHFAESLEVSLQEDSEVPAGVAGHFRTDVLPIAKGYCEQVRRLLDGKNVTW